jgi:hypothetical protein
MIGSCDQSMPSNDDDKENRVNSSQKRKPVAILSPEAKRLRSEKAALKYQGLSPEVKTARVLKRKAARQKKREMAAIVSPSTATNDLIGSACNADLEDCDLYDESEKGMTSNEAADEISMG